MKKEIPVTKFANKLHPKLNKPTENLFYSPHSLHSALGICTEGAREKTLESLINLLEVPSDTSERKSYFRSLVAETTVSGKPYELTTANALWSQINLGFVGDFQDTIRNDYGGSFNEVNFVDNPENAVEKINGWCNEATHGKIPTIIQNNFINKDTLLILTNAIYFLGKWKKKFDQKLTKNEDFYPIWPPTVDGHWCSSIQRCSQKIKRVPTMHISGEALYGETVEFKALDLPYEGDDLSMLILLPEGSTEYIDNNLAAAYEAANNSLRYEENVNISLPRFKLETEYNLGETLKELGGKLAFSDYADFSGITKDETLKISEVIHKAFVKCDEEGTEAAAATAVGMMRCSALMMPVPPKVFKADHPFVFFIRNTKTNTILFAGRVTQP